jgi:tetratricopeptide (TPR) repeat protein
MTTSTIPEPLGFAPFASLEEMRAVYNDLVRRYGKSADSELPRQFLDDATQFISRGRDTGMLLDGPEDRWDAQSMLNFWATILYRYGRKPGDEPPVTTLLQFGSPESARAVNDNVPFLAPPEPSEYVGREGFLADLKQRLLAGKNIALYGVSGAGKTSIATKLAHDPEVRERFSDGVLWANLGDRSGVSAILDSWSRALGIPVNDSNRFDIGYRGGGIRQAIGRRRMLLIIDDAWQSDKASALKLGGPNCAHIVTTYLMPVALDFDTEGTVVTTGLSRDDGLRLLAWYEPDVIKAQEEDARELIALLDGSPLALSLLTKWHKLQVQNDRRSDFKKLRLRLQAAKESFEKSQPSALPAVKSDQVQTPPALLATIEWCFKCLGEGERDVLQALSGFPPKPNSFSAAAARHVATDRQDELDTVTSYGLLERIDAHRYTLHRAVSDYLKRLPKENTDNAADRHMVQYFVSFVKDHPADSPLLEQEEKNILAALDIACERRMWRLLVEGTIALLGYFDRRGLYSLAKERLGRARRAAEKLKERSSLSAVFLHLGEMEERLGEYDDARLHLHAALQIAEQLEDGDLISRALQGLGVVAMAQANYPQAESDLNEALKRARKIGNSTRECAIYTRLGWIERGRGNYPKAKAYISKGLKLARDNQDIGQFAELLLSLGVLSYFEGNYEQAKKHDLEGLRYAEESKDRRLRCALLQALGGVEVDLGNYEAAQGHLMESLRLSREIGHRWYTSVIWKETGELRLKQQLLNAATESFIKALELAREVNSPELIGLNLYSLARVAAARGKYGEARLQGQTSLNIFQSIGHQKEKEIQSWLGTLPQ